MIDNCQRTSASSADAPAARSPMFTGSGWPWLGRGRGCWSRMGEAQGELAGIRMPFEGAGVDRRG